MNLHLTKFMLFCTLFLALMVSRQATAPIQAQSFSCSNVSEIPVAECEDLVALYNSTGGPTLWVYSVGWLSSNAPCGWDGITCSAGHVTQINLGANGLSGTIPTLSNLPNLIYLHLGQNDLGGTIPNLSNLSSLRELYLSSNHLTGVVPNLNWSVFTRLQLSNNCGLIPYNDAQATLLASKDGSWQQMSPACSNPPTPTPTFLSCNSVTEIPQTECQDLVTLYHSTNGVAWFTRTNWLLTNTPCSWYGITCSEGHVTEIFLNYNALIGAIPNFTNLPNLTKLSLIGNRLTGNTCSHVTEISQAECQDLATFYNSTNGANWGYNTNWLVTNIPCNWYGITCSSGQVSQIDLNNNELTGNISNLSNLTGLLTLNLSYNQLTGSIPDFANLHSLKYLHLAGNELTGSIPDFSNLSNLISINFTSNQLSGTIPNLNWSRFVYLKLYYNCGLVAFNAAQAEILSSKDLDWQQRSAVCFTATPTTTPSPTFTLTPRPTYTPTPIPTFTPIPTATPYAVSTVIPPTGGVFISPDGAVRVQIPNGLITDAMTVNINTLTQTIPLTNGFKLISRLFEIIAIDDQGQRLTQFNNPFTITFSYQDNAWLHVGQETDLSVYYWSELENLWVNLLPCEGCRQDTVNNRLIIQLNHLTEFALLVVDKRQRVYLPVIIR